MADRYCFVCDAAVDAETCPTCGTATWLLPEEVAPPADEHLPEVADEAPLAPVEARPLEPLLPPPEPPAGADLPGSMPKVSRTSPRTPGRWAPIAAVVVSGIVLLSVLAGPAGNAPDENETEIPTITAQTTTTVPTPGSSRGLWWPATGTWVGGFAITPNRPHDLFGRSLPAGLLDIPSETVIVDSLPDGRLVGVDADTQSVLLIGTEDPGPSSEVTPLPFPGPESTLPLLSPDGTQLAMIDASGVPYVWKVGSESALSLADSVSTAVEAIVTVSWSPNSTMLALNAFQGGYYLWDLGTNEVSRTSMPGRAIAISNSRVAAWGSDGLELRDLTGRVLRRWNDLLDPAPAGPAVPVSMEAAFDPLDRYLAVRGWVGQPGGEGQEGLTVLSIIGTTRQLLTTDPWQPFTWSGDGSGFYWIDATGLQVWSADPERASTTLVESIGDPLSRLRTYDPALSPVSHQHLATTALFERREGSAYIRRTDRLEQLEFEEGLATITPSGVPGYFLLVERGDADQPVTLANPYLPGSEQFLGNLNTLQLPEGARITRAIALTPFDSDGRFTPAELEATRWYLETDSGSILHGPEAELFTTAAEGSSLGFLGGTAFHLTPDGSAIRTIPVGVGINTVLTAEDLDAERILAVGAIRRVLFVLVLGIDGDTHLWQVPADSELLATPLFPPAPTMTSWAWIIYTFPEPASGGWILTDPDSGPSGELLAARIDGPTGPVTVAMAAPLALESVCGASAGGACVLTSLSGSPLGFSPDGHWLLVGEGDRYVALSTVGRGSVELPDGSPDDVAWVAAGG